MHSPRCGMTLRWVEVADDRGRSRLEMRWSEAAAETPLPETRLAETSLPVDPAAVAAATPVPPVTPAA